MKYLTEKHHTVQKLEKVFALMNELGIEISFLGHRTMVHDHMMLDKSGDLMAGVNSFDLVDAEDLTETIGDIPRNFDWKLVVEN